MHLMSPLNNGYTDLCVNCNLDCSSYTTMLAPVRNNRIMPSTSKLEKVSIHTGPTLKLKPPDSKTYRANMGPTWVLSDPDGQVWPGDVMDPANIGSCRFDRKYGTNVRRTESLFIVRPCVHGRPVNLRFINVC